MLWFKVGYNGKWVALMLVVFIIPLRMVRRKVVFMVKCRTMCRDWEIPLRSESFQPTGELNAPNFALNHVATVSVGLARTSPDNSFGSSASRIWESVRD